MIVDAKIGLAMMLTHKSMANVPDEFKDALYKMAELADDAAIYANAMSGVLSIMDKLTDNLKEHGVNNGR
jgi:molecular chaperone GrpE (heat shock protein)